MFLTKLFDDPTFYVLVVVVVVLSVVLHEMAHALTATWEGDPTPRARGHFTWNPVVHMGWFAIALLLVVGITFGRTPVTPAYFRHRRWGEALVAAAGPLTNLLLAVVGALAFAATERYAGATESNLLLLEFWAVVLRLNVTLFCLNLIPLPPLDGFTVAEGAFDLGDLGAWLRRLGMLPLIVAIFIVNSDPFGDLLRRVTHTLVTAAGRVFAA